jgi:hypothetical protein
LALEALEMLLLILQAICLELLDQIAHFLPLVQLAVAAALEVTQIVLTD